jgi:hypothetical protein
MKQSRGTWSAPPTPGSPRRHEGVERRASCDALWLLAMTDQLERRSMLRGFADPEIDDAPTTWTGGQARP